MTAWLRGDRVDEEPTWRPALPAGADEGTDESDEVAQLERRLLTDRRRAHVQRDPARLDVLSEDEMTADRAAVERLRGLQRADELAEARARAKLAGRARRARQRQGYQELGEQAWKARALARRERLLDPTSQLAAVYRTHWATSAAFAILAVAGIARMATNVGTALDAGPLGYAAEAVFTAPLLVLMWVSAHVGRAGRRFPATKRQRVGVYFAEVSLFLVSTTINTLSAFVGPYERTPLLVIVDLAMPALLVAIVRLQPIVAEALSEVLVSAHVAAADGERRLGAETVDVLELVARIRRDWEAGELRDWNGAPSISHVQQRYTVGKQRAQAAVDAWRKLCS